jgi:hypothetical protein
VHRIPIFPSGVFRKVESAFFGVASSLGPHVKVLPPTKTMTYDVGSIQVLLFDRMIESDAEGTEPCQRRGSRLDLDCKLLPVLPTPTPP